MDCSDAELEALAEQADFGGFKASRDLAPLRERLLRLERERGITEVHRRFSDKVLASGVRLVETPRDLGNPRAFALSPDGRHLAIASNRLDESHGGDVRIWELATGRVVDAVGFDTTRVGSELWNPSCLQWSPSGEWFGVILDRVIVGVLRAFAGTPPCFTADVTRRWGSPPGWAVINPKSVENMGHLPAWCWSPDEKQLFISTPGPDGALGCIVPFREGTRINEDSEGLRWCPARLDGQPSKSQPHTWVRWSPDGSCIHGYCKDDFVSDPNVDLEHDPPRPTASVLDVRSGDLLYRLDLQFRPNNLTLLVAFSPDGGRLAYGEDPPRLADGHTGRTMANLARRARVRIDSVAECVWSRDGRRLAVLINEYSHPKALIFEEGKLLCVVDLKGRRLGMCSWSHDLLRWAWSPDGSMGACLMMENSGYNEEIQGGIEVWKVGPTPGFLRRLEYASRIDGLAWGADDTLVGTGPHDIAFWDVKTGQRSPEEPATQRMFSVAGRHAWPWRWAEGTRHTR
jgi:WD40 repeat protein